MVASDNELSSNDSVNKSDSSTPTTSDSAQDRAVIKSPVAHVARSVSDRKEHNTLVLMWDDFPFSV
jgi:hypothetical protein